MRPQLTKDEAILTEEKKKLLNAVYKFLALNETVTKAQIQQEFKLDERTARDLVSTIAKRVPVVSLSSGKGYCLARNKSVLNSVFQSRAELASRRIEMIQREKPLVKFIANNFEYGFEREMQKILSDIRNEIRWLQDFEIMLKENIASC